MGRSFNELPRLVCVVLVGMMLLLPTSMTGASMNRANAPSSTNLMNSFESPSTSLSLHGQIRIDNDAQLADLITHNDWAGNGTAANPFVIEGLRIDAGMKGPGMFVGNTSSYLTIKNCEMSNSINSLGQYGIAANIQMYNVQNATVENCSFGKCFYGIYAVSCRNDTVQWNTFGNCTWLSSLRMTESSGFNIHHNVFHSGVLSVDTSSSNKISNNTFLSYFGVQLSSANGNLMEYNLGQTYAYNIVAVVGSYSSGPSASVIVTATDSTSPQVTINSPSEGAISTSSSVMASWSGTDSGTGITQYSIELDGGPWLNASLNSSWTFNGLVDGHHTLLVQASDGAGNSGNASVNFTVDTVAPTIIAHSPTGNNVTVSHTASITVTFSEEMNMSSVKMIMNGVNVTIYWVNNATFNPYRLSYNFTYEVNVSGRDLAGNSVEYSWSFTTAKQGGVIEGTIRDANGASIANATVSLDNGMTATTDANGHFIFTEVAAGSFNMTVTKDGYQTMTVNVIVTDGTTNDLGALSVQTSTPSTGDGIIVAAVALAIVAGIVVAAALLFRRRKI